MQSSDTFYRYAVAAGTVLAIFALFWGRWAAFQELDRLFALDEQQIQSRAAVEMQQSDVERVAAYGESLQRSIRAEKDHGSHHFFFLRDEADRTSRRLARARAELTRLLDIADLKRRQSGLIQAQLEADGNRANAIAILGAVLALAGLLMWYLLRQRWLDAVLRQMEARPATRPQVTPQQAIRRESENPWEEIAVWSADDPRNARPSVAIRMDEGRTRR